MPVDAAGVPQLYQVVLHSGDSTVGGSHGLAAALKPRFEAEGARYVSDTVNSGSLLTGEMADHVGKSIDKHHPDLVLINLGTNEVFVPNPLKLVPRIRAIVAKIGGRDCIWIGPPTWKGDKGLVDVLRDNVAPCRFFDSSNMDLERIHDGIHPTDKGGEEWGRRFWAFFRPPT
jgi:acyl-CoA thioesterase-1